MIGTTHIMLSILSKSLPTTDMLNQVYGVDYNSFKKMMKEMKEDYDNYIMDKRDLEEMFIRQMKYRAGIIK
jgi:hypothetical protein